MKNNNESVFFRYTEGMRKEDLPDTIFHLVIDKSVKRIPRKMFYERELKTIKFEGEVEIIEEFAFFDCFDVEYIYINARFIHESAFDSCYGLKSVRFGPNLKYIGPDAFANCKIEKIVFDNIDNCDCIDLGAFQNTNFDSNMNEMIIKHFGHNCFRKTYFDHQYMKEIPVDNNINIVSSSITVDWNTYKEALKNEPLGDLHLAMKYLDGLIYNDILLEGETAEYRLFIEGHIKEEYQFNNQSDVRIYSEASGPDEKPKKCNIDSSLCKKYTTLEEIYEEIPPLYECISALCDALKKYFDISSDKDNILYMIHIKGIIKEEFHDDIENPYIEVEIKNAGL